jgi:hypothetical protein
MSSLVVTAGATYSAVNLYNANSIITDYNKIPVQSLNPEIHEIVTQLEKKYHYSPNDRNNIIMEHIRNNYLEEQDSEEQDLEEQDSEEQDSEKNTIVKGGLDTLLFKMNVYDGGYEDNNNKPNDFFDW